MKSFFVGLMAWMSALFGGLAVDRSTLRFVLCDGDAIESLQDRLLDLQEQATSIQALADNEKRDLTEEEQASLDAIFANFEQVEAQISRRERINAQSQKLSESMGRQSEPSPIQNGATSSVEPASTPRIYVPNDPQARGRWGFRDLGEFANSVRMAVRGSIDPRLIANAPTTISTEGVGADGGYAVPPDFRDSIMSKIMSEASFLGRTDQLTTSSNSMTLPMDESTNWQTSGGIQAYWEGEVDQMTQSKISLKPLTMRLNKLTALVPITEELMEDAPTLDGYLKRKVPEVFDFKLNMAIVQGTGAGSPMGILNSGALVTVAKETSQVADTIVVENLVKMWARLDASGRANAVWLMNQDVEQTLMLMQQFVTNVAGTENVGGYPVYMPPGGISGAPYGTLFGKPVITTEACNVLGDLGDIVLCDLSKYLTVVKTAGIRQDISIHLWFDFDVAAYRFIFRVAGQPWLSAPISPRTGSNTRSPFVTLAERA